MNVVFEAGSCLLALILIAAVTNAVRGLLRLKVFQSILRTSQRSAQELLTLFALIFVFIAGVGLALHFVAGHRQRRFSTIADTFDTVSLLLLNDNSGLARYATYGRGAGVIITPWEEAMLHLVFFFFPFLMSIMLVQFILGIVADNFSLERRRTEARKELILRSTSQSETLVKTLERKRSKVFLAQLKPAARYALANAPFVQWLASVQCGPRKDPAGGHKSFRAIPDVKRSRRPPPHVEETVRLDARRAKKYAKEVYFKGLGMQTAPELTRLLQLGVQRLDLKGFRAESLKYVTRLGTRVVRADDAANRHVLEDTLCQNIAESAACAIGRTPGSELYAFRNDARNKIVEVTLLRSRNTARSMQFVGTELIESGLALARLRSGTGRMDASAVPSDVLAASTRRRPRVVFPGDAAASDANPSAAKWLARSTRALAARVRDQMFVLRTVLPLHKRPSPLRGAPRLRHNVMNYDTIAVNVASEDNEEGEVRNPLRAPQAQRGVQATRAEARALHGVRPPPVQ